MLGGGTLEKSILRKNPILMEFEKILVISLQIWLF